MSGIKIIRETAEINAGDWGTVAAVGNFDGVHLGHQKIIKEAEKISKELAARLAVLTFEPHPRMLFHNDDKPFRLTTSQGKASALSRVGVQLIFEL